MWWNYQKNLVQVMMLSCWQKAHFWLKTACSLNNSEHSSGIIFPSLANEVMFHTHSVYNPFLDSGMQWLTPAGLEQFVQHWDSVLTYSDNNKQARLIIYSNLEMAVQIPRKFSSHVLKRMFHVLESDRGNLSVGGRHLIKWCSQLNEVW